jgi:hypothetical protein
MDRLFFVYRSKPVIIANVLCFISRVHLLGLQLNLYTLNQ